MKTAIKMCDVRGSTNSSKVLLLGLTSCCVVLASCSSIPDADTCFRQASVLGEYQDRYVPALKGLCRAEPNWAAYLVRKFDPTDYDTAFAIWKVRGRDWYMTPKIDHLLNAAEETTETTHLIKEPDPFVSSYVELMVLFLHLEPRYPPDHEQGEIWTGCSGQVSRFMDVTVKGDPDVYEIWDVCLDFLADHTSAPREIFPQCTDGTLGIESSPPPEYMLAHRKEILAAVDAWFEPRRGRFVISLFFPSDFPPELRRFPFAPFLFFPGICGIDEQILQRRRGGGSHPSKK